MTAIALLVGAYLGAGIALTLSGPVRGERDDIVLLYEISIFETRFPAWTVKVLAALLPILCIVLWPAPLGIILYRRHKHRSTLFDTADVSAPDPKAPVGASMSPETVLQIGNCAFSFVCSKKWSELREVDASPNVRFCTSCEKNVFLCDSESEFTRRARAGECVAVHVDHTTDSDDEIMGLPAFEDEDGRDL